MSSTNKTTNYKLSQYVGTDKPTYLGDYNGDMLKIDTQMKENNDAATDAQQKAGEAVTKAEQANQNYNSLDSRVGATESNITQLQTTVKSLGDNVSTVSDKATSALNTANSANSLAEQVSNDLKQFGLWGGQQSIANSDVAVSRQSIFCNYNKDLHLLSLYGDFAYTGGVNGTHRIAQLPINIRPKTNRTIYNAINVISSIGGEDRVNEQLIVDTNGNISVPYPQSGGVYSAYDGTL